MFGMISLLFSMDIISIIIVLLFETVELQNNGIVEISHLPAQEVL